MLLVAALAAVICARGATGVASSIEDYIRAEIKLNEIPGAAVAVVRGGEIAVFAYRLADAATGRPMTVDTPVELASVSKSFTALGVLVLVRRGLVDWDAPAAMYLSELSSQTDSNWSRLTVQHLLDQRSGLRRRDDFRIPCCGQPGEFDLVLAVDRLRNARFVRSPGEVFSYANRNYILLAAIIERVSHRPFPDFMRDEVFIPLGLARTTLDQTQATRWGLAAGHERQWGRVANSPSSFAGWYGASLVKSTANDMGRYIADIVTLNSETANAVLPAHGWWQQRDVAYQLGWFIRSNAEWLDGATVVEHTGDIWKGNTAVVMAPELGLGVAVLLNVGTNRAGPLARGILAQLAGVSAPEPALAPATNGPDFWALCFLGTACAVFVLVAFQIVRVGGQFRRGERAFSPRKAPFVRTALLGLMAGYLLLLLVRGAPSMPILPTTIRVALPVLTGSVAVLLAGVALLGLAPRCRQRRLDEREV